MNESSGFGRRVRRLQRQKDAYFERRPLTLDEEVVLWAAWRAAGVPLPDGDPRTIRQMPPAERAAAAAAFGVLRGDPVMDSPAVERATRRALAVIRGRRLAQNGAKCPT